MLLSLLSFLRRSLAAHLGFLLRDDQLQTLTRPAKLLIRRPAQGACVSASPLVRLGRRRLAVADIGTGERRVASARFLRDLLALHQAAPRRMLVLCSGFIHIIIFTVAPRITGHFLSIVYLFCALMIGLVFQHHKVLIRLL